MGAAILWIIGSFIFGCFFFVLSALYMPDKKERIEAKEKQDKDLLHQYKVQETCSVVCFIISMIGGFSLLCGFGAFVYACVKAIF